MAEKKILDEIINKRQSKRKDVPQTRDLRRYIKRKDMQPKKAQLSSLHYELKKFKKRVILLEQKLDAFDRRLIETEDYIINQIEQEEKIGNDSDL